MSRIVAIVPAAGGGARFGARVPKQYAMLGGVAVLLRTLQRLRAGLAPQAVYVALAEDDVEYERLPGRPPDVPPSTKTQFRRYWARRVGVLPWP